MDSKNEYLLLKQKYLSMRGGNDIISNDNTKCVPKLSKSKNVVKIDLDDVKFSCCEYPEGPVGMTFIHFGNTRAKIHMDVRGGWPGYINTASTNDHQFIDGICIAGGSLLGLECVSGVMAEWLKSTDYDDFPAINGAIIYSQNFPMNKVYPDKNLGRFAFNNLSNKLYYGQVGAGRSAAKGQGVSFYELDDGIKILAIVVNNAVGSVYRDGKVISKNNMFPETVQSGKNTTITTIITNLELDNDDLRQLAHQCNAAMGSVIKPFNTFVDGDIMYTCSTHTLSKPGHYDNMKMINLYTHISDCVIEAIYNSLD